MVDERKLVVRLVQADVPNVNGDTYPREVLERAAEDIKKKKTMPLKIDFKYKVANLDIADAYIDEENFLVVQFSLDMRGRLVAIRFNNLEDAQKAKQIITKVTGEEIVIVECISDFDDTQYWEVVTANSECLRSIDFLRPCDIVAEHDYSIGSKVRE